jgi:hypothetical protein
MVFDALLIFFIRLPLSAIESIMTPENVLSIKLAWLELNAVGAFTIGTLAALTLVYFAMTLWHRRG